jgi:hypothetical protein
MVGLNPDHVMGRGKGPAKALRLPVPRRIERGPQLPIEGASTPAVPVHWKQKLDIACRIKAEALRNPEFHQLDHAPHGGLEIICWDAWTNLIQ